MMARTWLLAASFSVMPMSPVSLFDRNELASAYRLLLPDAEADRLTAAWFEMFGDELDPQGRAIFDGDLGPDDETPVDSTPQLPDDDPRTIARDEAIFATFDAKRADSLLVRLGPLQLGLVALVNDDLYERMRVAQHMTARQAARSRLQMTRAVNAYRRRVGLPAIR